MVESFVSGGTVEEKEIDFPVLMNSENSGVVVLASKLDEKDNERFCGVVVVPLSNVNCFNMNQNVGHYSDAWVTSKFTLCKSSITLKNKTE